MLVATDAPGKSIGVYAAKRVVVLMQEMGFDQNRAGVKSDHAPAILDLVGRVDVRASKGAQLVMIESSAVLSSASSGIAERGWRWCRGMWESCEAMCKRLGDRRCPWDIHDGHRDRHPGGELGERPRLDRKRTVIVNMKSDGEAA